MPTTIEETEKTETNENKKDELLLDSLEIKGYRCFEHLTIEKLGRVNLIVGKNNVGKTALLEALWIYGTRGDDNTLFEIALNRSEIQTIPNVRNDAGQGTWAYKNFFNNRPEPQQQGYEHSKQPVLITIGNSKNIANEVSVSFNQVGNIPPYIHVSGKNYSKNFNAYFVRFGGLKQQQIQELWKNIELTKYEDAIIAAVKIISDDLISLRLVEDKEKTDVKVPFARIINNVKPVELRSLGDGMNRLFEIALTIINCENGMIFIDEIESGLHYSVLPDVWKLIFKTAKDLNVQVFATTHSKDCIEAFTQAAIDDEESDGMLIRLENKDGKIRAVNFNEDELETVERRNIEVR